jgi:hypothetical protein
MLIQCFLIWRKMKVAFQGDREGRPSHIRRGANDPLYGRGDPRGRPGSRRRVLHTQHIQGVHIIVGEEDFQVAFRICSGSDTEQR